MNELNDKLRHNGVAYRIHTTLRASPPAFGNKNYVTYVYAIFVDGTHGGEEIYNCKEKAIEKHEQIIQCLKEGNFDYR